MPVKPWTGPPPFSGGATIVFGAVKPKRSGRISREDARALGMEAILFPEPDTQPSVETPPDPPEEPPA